MLAGLQKANPKAQIKVINIVSETDRFMIEGGRTTADDGKTITFGLGFLGRLIEEAQANPDKKFVYVFENIHNLKPEEAVALNEVLQEGSFSVKGMETKQTMLAAGISTAMFTTASGLVVAIPTLVLHSIIMSRTTKIIVSVVVIILSYFLYVAFQKSLQSLSEYYQFVL